MTDVNIEVHGSIGGSAFSSCTYVENFEINANSIITTLGEYAFNSLATSTPVGSRNIAPFDLRNSTFTSIGSSVWGANYYDGVIYFPSTLATINGGFLSNARENWTLYFNSVPNVSSSLYLRDDTGNFTVKYCFHYSIYWDAYSATNWSSHTSQMVAYGDGFAQGTTLPAYEKNTGVSLTWYSDISLSTPATTSSGTSTIYYCIVGGTRLVWCVNSVRTKDASITISDGTNTYQQGDFIPVGTTLTITPNYTDNTKQTLYSFKVNGVDYTNNGSATITMTQDLNVSAIYWDEVNSPYKKILDDNTWAELKDASEFGVVLDNWHSGDTKTLTYNGVSYTARLVDKTGKYKRVSDNTMAYLKFELTELLPDSEVYHSSGNNRPLQSQLLDKMNNGTIYNNIDSSLTSVIEAVKVEVSQGGGSSTENTLVNFEGKFFLQREHDLFSTRSQSVPAEWDAILSQDEYYQTHNTNADRVKKKQDSSSGSTYWEMSPNVGYNNRICGVNEYGGANSYIYDFPAGVNLVFAL